MSASKVYHIVAFNNRVNGRRVHATVYGTFRDARLMAQKLTYDCVEISTHSAKTNASEVVWSSTTRPYQFNTNLGR